MYPPSRQPTLGAQDAERQLYEQRRAAQQERQQQKNDRNQEIRDASSNLRQYATDLKNDYREQVRDLDTEFRLQQVDLRAEHQTRVAASEREFQTKMTSMYMQLANAEEETAKNLKAELVERINHTFELRKQAAEAEHSAKVAIEESKIALLDERDESIRAEADSLGLNQDYSPILAKPIGGELTDQEERWNDRERQEVERLKKNNLRLLSEYRNGPELRQWELANLKEDFKLSWEEKVEQQSLESQMTFFSPMFMMPDSNG